MPREDERAWNCRGRKLLKTKKAIFEKKNNNNNNKTYMEQYTR